MLVPLGRVFQKRWRVSDLTLRDRMGGGNFGQARLARVVVCQADYGGLLQVCTLTERQACA